MLSEKNKNFCKSIRKYKYFFLLLSIWAFFLFCQTLFNDPTNKTLTVLEKSAETNKKRLELIPTTTNLEKNMMELIRDYQKEERSERIWSIKKEQNERAITYFLLSFRLAYFC